jgi:LysR family transcriptional regulator, glycine cleavage system transcriptional activator
MTANHHRRLKALEAFEAVSRQRSIAGAADELGVTPSAISHQLRKLTEDLGEKLVERAGRTVTLTPAGKRLAARLQTAFAQIDRSVADVIGSDRDVLRLAVCSSFAPGWLIGRLRSFIDANPAIDLQLRMYARDPELTDHVADAFVTTLPTEAGFWSTKIMTERLVAVAAPTNHRFPGGLPPITTSIDPDDFASDWTAFSELSGIPLKQISSGNWLQASHYVLAIEMAKARLGVALVPDFLAKSGIEKGDLTLVSDCRLPTDEDYYLCVKTARRDEAGLKALVRWFRKQVEPDTGVRAHSGMNTYAI